MKRKEVCEPHRSMNIGRIDSSQSETRNGVLERHPTGQHTITALSLMTMLQ